MEMSGSAADRELADAEPSRLDDDNGAFAELVVDRREVREQKRGLLLRPTFGSAPEEEKGRLSLLAQGEQGGEVGVGGDDDSLLDARSFDDLLVACPKTHFTSRELSMPNGWNSPHPWTSSRSLRPGASATSVPPMPGSAMCEPGLPSTKDER